VAKGKLKNNEKITQVRRETDAMSLLEKGGYGEKGGVKEKHGRERSIIYMWRGRRDLGELYGDYARETKWKESFKETMLRWGGKVGSISRKVGSIYGVL